MPVLELRVDRLGDLPSVPNDKLVPSTVMLLPPGTVLADKFTNVVLSEGEGYRIYGTRNGPRVRMPNQSKIDDLALRLFGTK